MDLKLRITQQLRQLQLVMQRTSFRTQQSHSSFRGQGLILSILLEHPDISRKELGERVDISRQALTELLQKMEKAGRITRSPDPQDRRSVRIHLTPAGKAAALESTQRMEEMAQLLECLDPDQLKVFSECLDAILFHERELHPDSCLQCAGPEHCNHDYLKYGHTRPNPKFCQYAHLFPPEEAEPVSHPEPIEEAEP